MILKVLQLNINADNYWSTLIPFLTSHNFDIIQLQEVTGKDTICGNIASKRDGFMSLQNTLGQRYFGELAIGNTYTSSPYSYMGNATFYKRDISLVEKKVFWLNKLDTPFPSEENSFEKLGRNMLHLTLQKEERTFSIINTHLSWAPSPHEQPYQREKNKQILPYLFSLTSPIIFSGDFNIQADQPTIVEISGILKNLITENSISNTLNPRTHRVKQLFPPGLAVDYIFVSKDIQIKNFRILDEDLSDHLGLTAEVEF